MAGQFRPTTDGDLLVPNEVGVRSLGGIGFIY